MNSKEGDRVIAKMIDHDLRVHGACSKYIAELEQRIAELEQRAREQECIKIGLAISEARLVKRVGELEDLGWRLCSAIVTDSVHDGLPREIKDILERK